MTAGVGAADALTLTHNDVSLILDPAQGGAVRSFRWRDRNVFRPTAEDAGDDPFAYACFPLLPYANRIAHGRFTFEDREVQLAINWSKDAHAIHGQAWLGGWGVCDAMASSATLVFEGGGDEWPWRYRAQQHFALRDNGLTLTLSVINLSDRPMPAMLGIHPYFPDPQTARITARLPYIWRIEDGWPVEACATPDGQRFDAPRAVDSVVFDHSFSGWDGKAQIAWPDRRLRIEARNCPCMQVFTPANQNFFCLEPQTAAWGALNRGDADIVQPGKSLNITVDFTMEEI